MRALTLWQPWSWAVAKAGKRIENRSWPPPQWIIGEQIAIHAGLRIEREQFAELLDELGDERPADSDLVRGAIESVATVVGWVEHVRPDHPQARWFCGPCGWALDGVVALPRPVPCRGNRKLWIVPVDIEAEVRRQIQEAA